MKHKLTVISILVMSMAAAPALAQVQVTTISPPSSVVDPLGGFNVNYTLGGSSVVTTGQLTFFLSSSRDGSTGLTPLFSRQVTLAAGPGGVFVPPAGTLSQSITRSNMEPAARTLLQNLNPTGCQAQSMFIVAQMDFGVILGSNPTALGAAGRPDFEFTGGTLSPSVIRPGGTTFFTFDLFTRCAAPRSSTVAVLLTDVNLNVLAVIGTIGVGAGAGTFSLPPTGIQFGNVPLGNYRIVLQADSNNVIAESNENNNLGSFSLVVTRFGADPSVGADTESLEDEELETNIQLPYDLSTVVRELKAAPFPAPTLVKLD